MAKKVPKQNLEELATICWFNWNGRNDLLWGNSTNIASSVVNRAMIFFQQWKDCQEVSGGAEINHSRNHNISWVKPGRGWLKCNFDAALNDVKQEVLLIIRHDNSNSVLARNEAVKTIHEAFMEEAMSCSVLWNG